nr:unnamed protein product [Meloidogyne enterolobii]
METLPFGHGNVLEQQQEDQIIQQPHVQVQQQQQQQYQQHPILDLEDIPGSSNWTDVDYLRRYR